MDNCAVSQLKKYKETATILEKSRYATAIGSLLYLATCTRPDITTAVSFLARFMANPSPAHWAATKRVLIYAKSTAKHGLRISATPHTVNLDESINLGDFELIAYSDSDWACAYDRASVTGFAIFWNSTLIIWRSTRQTCISLSTCEAELVAASACSQELVWLRRLYAQLNEEERFGGPTPLLIDNTGALALCDDTKKTNRRTKHFELRHFYVRSLTDDKTLEGHHVASEFNVSDMLTKPLKRPSFLAHRTAMNVRPHGDHN